MSTTQRDHRINRLTLNVQTSVGVNNRADHQALNYRQQLRQHWQQLLPALEAGLDSADTTDRWVHIPKLTIHLQINNDDDLPSAVANSLTNAVRNQLQEQLLFDKNTVADELSQYQYPDNTQLLQQYTIEQNDYAVLLHYLNMGNLPWYQQPTINILQQWQQIITKQPEPLIDFLSRCESVYGWFRITQILEKESLIQFLVKLIESHSLLLQQEKVSLPIIIQSLINTEISTRLSYRYSAIIASLFFTLLQKENKIADVLLLDSQKLDFDEWQVISIQLVKQSTVLKPTIRLITALSKVVKNSVIEKAEYFKPLSDKLALSQQDKNKNNSILNSESISSTVTPITENKTKTAIVTFAGIVLLHAYLSRLFKACKVELTPPNTPVDTLCRAAVLLHYLATGDDSPQEFQLGFIKVLLGLSQGYPLPITADILTDDHKQEAEAVLSSLIQYWSVLKNTSPDGLRHSFLNRQGYLKKTEQGWTLTIDRTGYDVLLDSFPYAYSVVKLPWMSKPIQVEW